MTLQMLDIALECCAVSMQATEPGLFEVCYPVLFGFGLLLTSSVIVKYLVGSIIVGSNLRELGVFLMVSHYLIGFLIVAGMSGVSILFRMSHSV